MTRARKTGSALAPASKAIAPAPPSELPALLLQVQTVLRLARQQAHRSINRVMVEAYWRVGQLIVEHEQAGHARAAYGERVLDQLAQRLKDEFGAGFSVTNLRNFRQFHLTFGWNEIRDTPCSELSWSHWRTLMRVADPAARRWYGQEAQQQVWSVAALRRQISTLYYERLLSSQDKAGVRAEARELIERDAAPDPRDFIRDPYVLEFLGAQPGAALYEKDVEQGLLDDMFDGQMRQSGDNPTFGLILCSERNEAVARYSLLADSEQLFASRYRLWLPTEEELKTELERDRALIEAARTGEGGA